MTELLLRIFVKNSAEMNAPDLHSAIGRLAGTTGIVCNVLLFAVKLALGILSSSLSIVADAMNNLSDAASSVITLAGFQMARRPADQRHPYGHARYEYLSGFIVATLILLIGLELGKSSVEHIIHPRPVHFTALTLAIMLLSILMKLWMALFFRRLGRKINSSALLATSADSRNDVITTLAVLCCGLANIFFRINIDPWVGLGVSLFILWSGVGIAKDTISPLIGHGADTEMIERLEKSILAHDRILGIHDLMVHDYGPGKYYASVHVELSAEEHPQEAHDLIDLIEYEALKELGVHLVIHYDPVPVNDAEYNEMRVIMGRIIADLNPDFSIHDFRILRTQSQSRLIFDLGVPYNMLDRQAELEQQVAEKLRENGKNYKLSIHFDGNP